MKRAVELWDSIRNSKPDPKVVSELKEMVNSRLTEIVSAVAFEITAPHLKPGLQIVPKTLGGAMWLQLAQAIGDNKKYRACEACPRYFELSRKTARTSKFYCNDACRSKAYRERKAQARALANDGKSLKTIAKELNSDIATVIGWLEEPER
jgi:hypothetical protein